MNNQRRKQIDGIINKLSNLIDELENIKSDEEDYYDNMPENLQGSIRGEVSQEAIDKMEECVDKLNDVLDDLEECKL